jgi:hypothetical protein
MTHKKVLIKLFSLAIISTFFLAFMPEPKKGIRSDLAQPNTVLNMENYTIAIDSAGVDLKDFIVFEKTTHDFGNVTTNTKARYQFSFVNKSNEPVVIKKVKASCGCTSPSYSQEPVQPGETGYVVAVYSAPGAPQSFHKSITVETSHGIFVLHIKGNVVAEEVKETPVRVN